MRLVFTDIRTKLPLPLIERRITEFVGWVAVSFDVVLCTFANNAQRVCVSFPTDLTESGAMDAIQKNLASINAPVYRRRK